MGQHIEPEAVPDEWVEGIVVAIDGPVLAEFLRAQDQDAFVLQFEVLDDRERLETALIDAVNEAGATLLHIHLHKFEDGGGISGVAVLAESHISVHTWPEKGFAAFDVFMCGDAEPRKAIDVFKRAFKPGRVVVGEHKRGVV